MEIRRRGVGQDEARILGGNSGLQRPGIEFRGFREQFRELVVELRAFP